MVEHAKRYPPFLRAITRKESFDRLVRIDEHDEPYSQDGWIVCSSIIGIFDDISDIYSFEIELSHFARTKFLNKIKSLKIKTFEAISREKERRRGGESEKKKEHVFLFSREQKVNNFILIIICKLLLLISVI